MTKFGVRGIRVKHLDVGVIRVTYLDVGGIRVTTLTYMLEDDLQAEL